MSEYAAEAAATQTAAGFVNDLIGDAAAEAPAEPETAPAVEQPVYAAEPEPQATQPAAPDVEIPSFAADVDGIEDILEFDFDDVEDDGVPVARATEEYEPDEYDDENTARLKAKLAKLEKQVQYQQQLRAKDNEAKWRSEAQRRFPLADVDEINATSRRAFLKKAHEQHARYARKVEPIIKQLDDLKSSLVAEVKQEAREQAQQAWGRPTTGPQVQTVQAAEDADRLDRRKYRSVHEVVAARIRNGFQI